MKNVTVTIDDDTHRRARIRAAERGTSLSALVKKYLNTLADDDRDRPTGVREMPQTFAAAPPSPPPATRTLGAMKGEIWMADDWTVWPDDIQTHFDSLLEGGIDSRS